MSNLNARAANYTLVTGVSDIIIPAEQVIGFMIKPTPTSGSVLTLYDGTSQVLWSFTVSLSSTTWYQRLIEIPVILKNNSGMRVTASDATLDAIIFWL